MRPELLELRWWAERNLSKKYSKVVSTLTEYLLRRTWCHRWHGQRVHLARKASCPTPNAAR